MPMENPTRPSLYSFFQGLKNVFTKSGRENSSRNALFSEPKKARRPTGASKNQNLRKTKGRLK